ncbi:MAG: ABC transporter substrate-binding protein, partial [Spirochaetaceae bacterium]|nr:ABC transporter substrate-binding protein [Spirochaetaceae bacterium]
MDVKRIDRFVAYLILAVLAAALVVRPILKEVIKKRNTVLVFTQWWRDELEQDALESLVRQFEA